MPVIPGRFEVCFLRREGHDTRAHGSTDVEAGIISLQQLRTYLPGIGPFLRVSPRGHTQNEKKSLYRPDGLLLVTAVVPVAGAHQLNPSYRFLPSPFFRYCIIPRPSVVSSIPRGGKSHAPFGSYGVRCTTVPVLQNRRASSPTILGGRTKTTT